MPDVLLKRWSDWSAGVGHPIEEGAPGMYTANKILGLRGELRPAPVATSVTVGAGPGHHFQYFFEEPVSAGQTPAVDASSSGSGENVSSLTISHAVADQPNRILLVGAFGAGIPTSVTYAGEALARIDSQAMGEVLSLWYMVAPTVGTANIVITWAVSNDFKLGVGFSFYNTDQASPVGIQTKAAASDDGGPATTDVVSNSAETVVGIGASTDTVQGLTKGAGQTLMKNVTVGDGRLICSYETGAATTTHSYTVDAGVTDWGVIAVPLLGASPGPSYLYAQRGRKDDGGATVLVNKVSLANNDFANLETGSHDLTPLTTPGQTVRYQGYWWFPMGDNQKARRLQVVGSGAVANDTLDATGNQLGADHFANLGSQVAAALIHGGSDNGGIRILKLDGDIGTEADWGSVFEVGDRNERAAGLASLAGLSFVLNIEGLYSFDKNSRSGLVFEDFRAWRHVFDNIPIVPWQGGLVLSHPTGLLFWVPGELPVNIGLNADTGGSAIAPSGPPQLRGGRYHGLAPAGRFLYQIYQPDISSTTANVMVSYPRENNPRDLIHQQLGTVTLQDRDHMLGCFVSVGSKPISSEYVTPTLWRGDSDNLAYTILGTDASPFRTRADTHAVETAGDAYLSELLFEKPTPLTRMVVYAQNMASGDEWQLKFIADGEEEKNLGPPIKRNGRHELRIDRHDVYRLMLRVNWASTVTSARVAPSLQRIELYGNPGREGS